MYALVSHCSPVKRSEYETVGVKAPYAAGTTTYSPTTADAFYSARPLLVANRMLKLAYLTSAFTTGVLFDWLVLGKLLKDEEYTALKEADKLALSSSLPARPRSAAAAPTPAAAAARPRPRRRGARR